MTNTLVPDDVIERAAHLIDQDAFSPRDPMDELNRPHRQAAARHKATGIIKLVIQEIAAAQDLPRVVFLDPGSERSQNEFPQPNRPHRYRYPRRLLSRARAE